MVGLVCLLFGWLVGCCCCCLACTVGWPIGFKQHLTKTKPTYVLQLARTRQTQLNYYLADTTVRPNHPNTQTPKHPTTQPPNHPTTQPPNHQTTKPPNHLHIKQTSPGSFAASNGLQTRETLLQKPHACAVGQATHGRHFGQQL